jgi:hypothetical protein
MNTRRSIALSIAPFILGLFTLPASGCHGQGDALDGEHIGDTYTSFEEFEATVYREPDTGIYIVDGDTPIETREALLEFYERYIHEGALIINQVGSTDDMWSATQKLNLTYCVST